VDTSPALRQAIALLRMPTLAGAMRDQPLPDDILFLIKLAAGDEESLVTAAEQSAETEDRVRSAAILYLQSVLLAPNADHYRALGTTQDASQEEIRLHLTWLMKWVHPDRAASDWESVFANRVLLAWDAIKTRERRDAYDLQLAGAAPRNRRQLARRRRELTAVRDAARVALRSPRRSRWRAVLAAGVCVALATATWAASGPLMARLASADLEAQGDAAALPAAPVIKPVYGEAAADVH
jgi:hypothetical protein